MEEKLIEKVSQLFMKDISWNVFESHVSEDEIDKETFTNRFNIPLAINFESGVEKDMLKVQIEEARDEGYIEIPEEMDDVIDQMTGIMVFDLTEKGREFILPYVKDKLVEEYRKVIDKINSIE